MTGEKLRKTDIGDRVRTGDREQQRGRGGFLVSQIYPRDKHVGN